MDHAAVAERTGLAIRERYGMTETLILTAARVDRPVRPGTVGHPLRDTERLLPTPLALEPLFPRVRYSDAR